MNTVTTHHDSVMTHHDSASHKGMGVALLDCTSRRDVVMHDPTVPLSVQCRYCGQHSGDLHAADRELKEGVHLTCTLIGTMRYWLCSWWLQLLLILGC